MNKTLIAGCFLVLIMVFVANCSVTTEDNHREEKMKNRKRILLLGASVGKGWELKEFPQRVKNDNYIIDSIAFYEFDKTAALEEILMRPKRKFRLTRSYLMGFFKPSPQRPDVIIIKECAAYFPGELTTYKELIKKWVKDIHDSRIEVVLATTVPITPERDEKRQGQIESILEFNDWIREYSSDENITLLDLEAALRQNDERRFLREDLTSGDGLHLNKKAYGILDHLLEVALRIKYGK